MRRKSWRWSNARKNSAWENILITHALTNIPGLSMEQARQVAQMGAFIEYCFLQSMTGPDAQHAWMKHWSKVSLKDVAQVVDEIGANSLVLSSDLGQHGNMTHPDAMEDMITGLLKEGVSQADIDLMVKKNPGATAGFEGLGENKGKRSGWYSTFCPQHPF